MIAVQKLISNGHRLEEVRKYTLKQAQSFLKVIAKEEKKKHAMDSLATAMAFSKDFSKWIKKELTDG